MLSMEGGVKVPSYFLCPISLDIMRDPVTMLTGITYDRASIERWLFTEKHGTCPVSKQATPPDSDLTPNHTLRRLIQAWCTAYGVERFPTPKPPVDVAYIARIVDEGMKSPDSKLTSLKKLKDLVAESDRNRRCVQSCSGAVDFLVSTINKSEGNEEDDGFQALSILYSLKLTDKGFADLVLRNRDLVESLTKILRKRSNLHSRTYAMMLLKPLVGALTPAQMSAVDQELVKEVVEVVRDRISYHASKAALKTLIILCPWGRNRVRVAEADAVAVIVEQLLDEPERRATEMMLDLLDQLCMCAEGRVEFLQHAAGIAVVSRKMVRVSPAASKFAVSILYAVAGKQWTAAAVVEELLQVGAVGNMCLLLQMNCGERTGEKVKDMLRMHGGAWKTSPCLSPQLQASLYLGGRAN